MDKEADNVAFTAKEFNMDDFKEDTIDVTLQLSDDKRRRRRASESNVVKGLLPNVTYRSSQWNYNAFGVSTKSYWSMPFEFAQDLTQQSRETSGKVATELCKECSKTSLYIVISISLIINAVLAVVVIYLYMRLPKRQPPAKDKVVVNIDNEVFSDDIYDEVHFPPSTCEPNVEKNTTNAYEELNLTDKKQDEHAYQSLVKNPVC